MDLRLNDMGFWGAPVVLDLDNGEEAVATEEIDALDPFLSLSVPRLEEEEDVFKLFILNTLRNLFDNDNFVFIDISD